MTSVGLFDGLWWVGTRLFSTLLAPILGPKPNVAMSPTINTSYTTVHRGQYDSK